MLNVDMNTAERAIRSPFRRVRDGVFNDVFEQNIHQLLCALHRGVRITMQLNFHVFAADVEQIGDHRLRTGVEVDGLYLAQASVCIQTRQGEQLLNLPSRMIGRAFDFRQQAEVLRFDRGLRQRVNDRERRAQFVRGITGEMPFLIQRLFQ